jgi:Spy/CpxP family protein refolding chaperone
MKKIMTIIAVVALAAIVTSPAEARRGGWGGGYQGGGYYDIAAAPGLSLTAEQTAKLNDLREKHLRNVKPIQDKMYGKRGELRTLWLERTPDQKKISAVDKDIRNLREQLYDKQTAYRLESLKVLTPEQQARVQTYGQGRGKGYGPRMGYGRDPGWRGAY